MESTQNSTSPLSGLARMFWMLVGPATLFILAYAMVTQRDGWWSTASLAFLVILPLVLLARWLDPLNAEGEPAAPDTFRRYTAFALPAGLALWGIANWVANHWLAS